MNNNNNFSALIKDRSNHLYCGSWKYCAPDDNGKPSIPCQDQNSSSYNSRECQLFRKQQDEFLRGYNISEYLVGCYNNTRECAEAGNKLAKEKENPYKPDRGHCDRSKIKHFDIDKSDYDNCLNYTSFRHPYCYEHSIYKYKYEDPYQKDETVCYIGDDPCGLNCDEMSIYRSTPKKYVKKCCPGNKIKKDPKSNFKPVPKPLECQYYTPCYDNYDKYDNLKYYCGNGEEDRYISVPDKKLAKNIGKAFFECIPFCEDKRRFKF